MKELKLFPLKSGYTLKVIVTDNNVLAAQLVNNSGEFVGQQFTSEESLAKAALRLSNGELSLTDDEVAKLGDGFDKLVAKNDSASKTVAGILLNKIESTAESSIKLGSIFIDEETGAKFRVVSSNNKFYVKLVDNKDPQDLIGPFRTLGDIKEQFNLSENLGDITGQFW